jgi:hypothetical protein
MTYLLKDLETDLALDESLDGVLGLSGDLGQAKVGCRHQFAVFRGSSHR